MTTLSAEENKKLSSFSNEFELNKEEALEILIEVGWDMSKAKDFLKKRKKPKEKKLFKVGDIIKCIDNNPGKMPKDCVQFLLTYKKFKVLDVNEKLNIDIGHRLEENGNPYYFSPNRFELLNGTAPTTVVSKSESKIEESENVSPVEKVHQTIFDKAKSKSSPHLTYPQWKEERDRVTKSGEYDYKYK